MVRSAILLLRPRRASLMSVTMDFAPGFHRRDSHGAQCLPGGGIRGNRDYPLDTEFFFLSDLETEMPFNNELVVVDMPGHVLSEIVSFTRSFSFVDPPVEYGGFMQVVICLGAGTSGKGY